MNLDLYCSNFEYGLRYWSNNVLGFFCSFEELPEDVQAKISVLNLADRDVYIEGTGKRTRFGYHLEDIDDGIKELFKYED